MNEQTKNPFEQEILNPQNVGNPFAPMVTGEQQDTEGTNPVSVNLGSQAGASNIFETAEFTNPPNPNSVLPPSPVTNVEAENQVQEAQEPITPGEIVNPITAAVEQQNQESLFTKLPIFEYGSVKELIEKLEQTFEDLREEKSADFPEFEDAVRVTWDVVYGKIRKTVPAPKKTKIGDFKRTIETSKEFSDALKKDKNKSPDCIIKPRITAQSKGERLPSYKGIFSNYEESRAAIKAISIVPGRDGNVYEIRNTEAGEFITPTNGHKELSEIEAGFNPALPLIPRGLLLQIIGFFRSLMVEGNYYEAIANILWDRENHEFCVHVPQQKVTSVNADSSLASSDEYESERFFHYMDVHSHNVMPARFSETDDADEKATRLYAIIGKLGNYIPEINVRISNGGKYLLIDPATVFEAFEDYHPAQWNEQVTFKTREEPRWELPKDIDWDTFFKKIRLGRGLNA